MALELDEIQALTDDIWMPGAANNWIMGNIFMFKLLDKSQAAPSGKYVRQVLEYAKARGGAMGATTVFDTTKKAIFNAARFPWAMFWSGTTYDIDDEVEVSGGDADVDIVMGKLDNVQSTIKDYMGDSIWTAYATSLTTYGAETRPFYGIADMLNVASDTSPAFGRINRADLGTFTNAGTGSSQNIWQSYSSGTAYVMGFDTLQLLSRCTRVGKDNSKEIIDLIVTTPTLKDSFEAQLQPAQRFYDADLAKAGFEHVNFRANCPVVTDDKCPANTVDGFNMGKIHFKHHQAYNFSPPVWKEPTDMALKTCQIKWVGGFVTGARRAHGTLTNVSAG